MLLLAALTGWQYQLAQAPAITLEYATVLNPWGNEATFIYRGHPATVNITLNSASETNVHIHVTLFDVNNVPVAVTSTDTVISDEESIAIDLWVASYAYIGIAQFRVVITDQDSRSLATLSIPTYIILMGDFDLDNKITSNDVLIFLDAFDDFSNNQKISSQYQMCDIDGDKKIGFTDFTLFATSYIEHNNYLLLL
jgi:hypothetical protein